MVDEKLLDGVPEEASPDTDLLSGPVDDFLDKPNTDTELPTVKAVEEESNICVAVNSVEVDGVGLRGLLLNLKQLCAINQAVTDKHKVAVLTYFTDNGLVGRYGYCDELSARSIVYRLCSAAGIEFKVYRDYGTPRMKEIKEEDLDKRPFRF